MFCNELSDFLGNEAHILNTISFSDDAHFHSDTYVNKQNTCYWAIQNPEIITDDPLHPQHVTMWCAYWHIQTLFIKDSQFSGLP